VSLREVQESEIDGREVVESLMGKRSIIRLAAGRQSYSEAQQALCFMAGANAIFTGDAMLTTPCTPWDEDKAMLKRWGLQGMASFDQKSVRTKERFPIRDSTTSLPSISDS